MFLTLEEHYNQLNKLIDTKPNKVLISTYGIYCNILDDGTDLSTYGSRYEKQSQILFDRLKGIKAQVFVLVGLYQYKSCKKNDPCDDCEQAYIKGLRRLHAHANHWPEFTWKYANQCHLKCFIAIHHKQKRIEAVSGGRNMTDSEWVDASFPVTEKDSLQRLVSYYSQVWKNATNITEDNLAAEIVRQINGETTTTTTV